MNRLAIPMPVIIKCRADLYGGRYLYKSAQSKEENMKKGNLPRFRFHGENSRFDQNVKLCL